MERSGTSALGVPLPFGLRRLSRCTAGGVEPRPYALTIATVDAEALFDLGISGSGAGAKTILLTNRNRKFHVNVR